MMKTEINNGVQQPMMSSREIATLTGKDIGKVHRDIRAIVPALYSVDSGDDVKSYSWGTSKSEMNAFLAHHNIQGVTAIFDDRGYVYEFLLDRRHTEILVSGYDIKRRAAIIDRWHALESGEAQPRISAHQTPQVVSTQPDMLSLARVVAEATASATMKAVMEVMGDNLITSAPEKTTPLHVDHVDQASQEETNEPEYVPVHKVSWASGLSDGTCRRLVTFSDLPNCYIDGIRGLCVHRAFFMAAVEVLIKESTPPAKSRKRWQHPEFGGFELRKDPAEIFGEGEA
ncbi:Phage regulatory protein Rha (Phage_pRha) [Raoultella ornithinolytica]|nr:Phage regulatory protein Rha (Phage_pRha) [Raoultella ornithinolytica]